MTKQQLTGWFPGHIKPVRPGVYPRRMIFDEVRYARWDGLWKCSAPTPEEAALEQEDSPLQDEPDWCGLANPPKE